MRSLGDCVISCAFLPYKVPYPVVEQEKEIHFQPVRFLKLEQLFMRNGFLKPRTQVIHAKNVPGREYSRAPQKMATLCRIRRFGQGDPGEHTVHNIQADVPPENIVAMWNAVREFGVCH